MQGEEIERILRNGSKKESPTLLEILEDVNIEPYEFSKSTTKERLGVYNAANCIEKNLLYQEELAGHNACQLASTLGHCVYQNIGITAANTELFKDLVSFGNTKRLFHLCDYKGKTSEESN